MTVHRVALPDGILRDLLEGRRVMLRLPRGRGVAAGDLARVRGQTSGAACELRIVQVVSLGAYVCAAVRPEGCVPVEAVRQALRRIGEIADDMLEHGQAGAARVDECRGIVRRLLAGTE